MTDCGRYAIRSQSRGEVWLIGRVMIRKRDDTLHKVAGDAQTARMVKITSSHGRASCMVGFKVYGQDRKELRRVAACPGREAEEVRFRWVCASSRETGEWGSRTKTDRTEGKGRKADTQSTALCIAEVRWGRGRWGIRGGLVGFLLRRGWSSVGGVVWGGGCFREELDYRLAGEVS